MEKNTDKLPVRRKNRLASIQFLYMWELNPPKDLERGIEGFFLFKDNSDISYSFAKSLIKGTIENIDVIDKTIQEHAQNWTFSRIAKVDLSILRLALYELLFREDIPPIVTINEAIDLTKMLSTKDSKRFINGILDKVKGTLDRPLRSPKE